MEGQGAINIQFNLDENQDNGIIKVIGVGGGGSNAVNHMFDKGIHAVSFAVCNTDRQALSQSPIPTRVQLGDEGLGAGNDPKVARAAAEQSIEAIRRMLNDGTRMAVITAGMGGGTGTGAAPVIAKCAKDMGILTVGIVTIPRRFEGNRKIDQALDGVEAIAANVDALLVINNERLREIYPELTLLSAFAKADDTLCVAARSIAEIITVHGHMNLDFKDVTTFLKDGGVALISTGYGEGENRLTQALKEATNSPLLNNNDIYKSKKVLLGITFSTDDAQSEMSMEEVNEISEFMARFENLDLETKWGVAVDPELGSRIKVTILATGFGLGSIDGMEDRIQRLSTEERQKLEEEIERNTERRAAYYSDTNSKAGRTIGSVHSFIFGPDELDNDNIISLIEESATYNRKSSFLRDIRSKNTISVEAQPSSHDTPTVIDFA